MRSFRISRILKLIGKLKALQQILQTFINAIPEMINVGGLLTLFIYLYSVLGVFLFAHVKLNNQLSEHANFQTFGNAALTLFRISTGESWNTLMFDCGRQRSIDYECVIEQTYEEQLRDGI